MSLKLQVQKHTLNFRLTDKKNLLLQQGHYREAHQQPHRLSHHHQNLLLLLNILKF